MPAMRPWHLWGVLCLGTVLLASCGREGVSASPPEEDEKTAQVTVWSDRFEIFLEHRVLVVNTPTKFITHVTDLTTLEPRREGLLGVGFSQAVARQVPLTAIMR